jgi:hypothetical protein
LLVGGVGDGCVGHGDGGWDLDEFKEDGGGRGEGEGEKCLWVWGSWRACCGVKGEVQTGAM